MSNPPTPNDVLWDRATLTVGNDGMKKLHQARVVVVGQGSLGSWVTIMLAMSGVGNYTLIDPDTYSRENCMRHAADLRAEGKLKVEVMKNLILQRNPEAKVTTLPEDVLDHPEALTRADLVLVCGLGSEMMTSQLAEMLWKQRIPALYGGLYERAIAGDLFFVDPKQSDKACYHCIAHYVSDSRPETRQKVNYGMAPDELKRQPGLGPDIVFVAAPMAKWALRILINDPKIMPRTPGNYLMLANERHNFGEKDGEQLFLRAHDSIWYTIPKLEGCMICSLEQEPSNLSDISDIL